MDTASKVSIVIGSWGSYNACNERALGSKWLDLSEFSDWDQIVEELEKEGFELDGIDEELFIQDIEGIYNSYGNWNSWHPKTLFDILDEAGVHNDSYKYDKMTAFIEVRCFDDFVELVRCKGRNWDSYVNIYPNYDWSDYGIMMFSETEENVPERLSDFIDFEAYARHFYGDMAEEYDGGIIEIID